MLKEKIMNKYLVAGIVVLSLLVIVFGRVQYNQKLTNISTAAQQLISEEVDVLAGEQEDEAKESITSDDEDNDDENSEIDLQESLENVPPALADTIETKLTANESVTILAFGSQSLTDSQVKITQRCQLPSIYSLFSPSYAI